ncbi:hypothetical protein L227DRAFT_510242, partial [Lentinus tigrinus ALCF2SS1-6]
ALLRDDFRCMVTGKIDLHGVSLHLVEMPPPSPTTVTECAHIFPQSLGFPSGGHYGADEDVLQKNHVATTWAILNRFGYTGMEEELAGSSIHRLENVLTLDAVLHHFFDQLYLWFEAVPDKPHTYRIETRPPYFPDPSEVPREVTFTSRYNLPLPSPKYLRIHAACCRIAHLSGAVEYLDKVYRDREDLGVLAEDGASAPVLSHLLQRLSSIPTE